MRVDLPNTDEGWQRLDCPVEHPGKASFWNLVLFLTYDPRDGRFGSFIPRVEKVLRDELNELAKTCLRLEDPAIRQELQGYLHGVVMAYLGSHGVGGLLRSLKVADATVLSTHLTYDLALKADPAAHGTLQ